MIVRLSEPLPLRLDVHIVIAPDQMGIEGHPFQLRRDALRAHLPVHIDRGGSFTGHFVPGLDHIGHRAAGIHLQKRLRRFPVQPVIAQRDEDIVGPLHFQKPPGHGPLLLGVPKPEGLLQLPMIQPGEAFARFLPIDRHELPQGRTVVQIHFPVQIHIP